MSAEAPTRTQVQAALRALARAAIVRRTDERGGYAFNDPLLAQWIEAQVT